MARPKKEGLDYFPLDVDMDQDDKVALIEAKHGIVGFGVVVKLLMKIYKEGYFYNWKEKEQLLLASRVNVDINLITEIINDCIKWGLFDQRKYEKHSILTSKGIQKRYIEAIVRRKEVTFLKEFLMIVPENHIGNSKIKIYTVNADINEVNVDINPYSEGVNADNSTQSKVKESKVKDLKDSCRKLKTYNETNVEFQLSLHLLEKIKENNSSFKEPNLQNWSDNIRLMMERDKRTEEQIKYLIDWCQNDSFWKGNILSPAKLRKQFDSLTAQAKVKSNKTNKENPKKVLSLDRPAHLKEPTVPNDIDKKIEENLKGMPY